MGKTAVGLYETSAEARQVLGELVKANFDRSNIRIMLGDQATRRVHEWLDDQPANTVGGSTRWQEDGASETLIALGVPRGDAHHYEEALHRGHALVSVATTDQRIDEAVDIMSRHHILDVHERRRRWNMKSGAEGTLETGEHTTVPVIEEEVRVGKREVERGGVRIRAHVTETPVEETVNLREERVHVERRPADRPVKPGDVDAMRDRTIEVKETAEEAVIDKQARVVEEVVVRKEADTRQEHVRDTVRRTDVDVEQMGEHDGRGWERFNNDFHTHYSTYFANTGHDYAYYEPAYRYGYTLASRPDWRGRDWSQIEADARRDWESRHQGPWENFKDAVRHAWQRATT
jgi:uncharacterized protein (TIGR02271 family)